jgi:hypothetical protein
VINPATDIKLDFRAYVEAREKEYSEHLVNGVPDYAFSLDRTLHQRLDSITLLRKLVASAAAFSVNVQMQM